MTRFYQNLFAHRNVIKVVILMVSVAAMSLGFASGVLADDGDGFGP
ncbi:MAG: hypothetical protein HW399_896 [Dehalococcoidia bacterium]|nr:hypothetical protein [Dehalococcoidia bacterium]